MCRSIKRLRPASGAESPDATEVAAAARQFVKKVSGYQRPARYAEPAFERAVAEVAAATERLLAELGPAG